MEIEIRCDQTGKILGTGGLSDADVHLTRMHRKHAARNSRAARLTRSAGKAFRDLRRRVAVMTGPARKKRENRVAMARMTQR